MYANAKNNYNRHAAVTQCYGHGADMDMVSG